jgi:hypothetical protein
MIHYGDKENFKNVFCDRLLSVDINVISNSACQSMNELYSTRVTDTMLCAGVPGGGKVN